MQKNVWICFLICYHLFYLVINVHMFWTAHVNSQVVRLQCIIRIYKKKCNPHQIIKVGYRCHFIMCQLYMHLDDVIITYTECRHNGRSSSMCHNKNAMGRPQTFKYVTYLSLDIRDSVKKMIEDGFNVTMVWDKFIYDVEHKYNELFTRVLEIT